MAVVQFPLVARSGRIRKLVANLADSDNPNLLQLTDVPGGAEAFDLAAKFCYGINFEITTSNVAVLRCAAESLEMTESYGENNLVARTESYLSEVVLQSLADAIAVLHNCENLLPLAEDLGIVSRCIEAAATKACRCSLIHSLSPMLPSEVSSCGCLVGASVDNLCICYVYTLSRLML